ncbi:MAG: hypothetical protein NVSMB52_01620 [Chloroflexota bacterium]
MLDSEPTVEQRQDEDPAESQPYTYYALLMALYSAMYGGFLYSYRKKNNTLDQISSLDLTMLGLATLRISKAISEDEISAVLREPLVEVRGTDRIPKGRGLRWALGKLVLCPTCTGTWVAAFLTYALHLFPRSTRPFLAVMAASGAEQFSDAVLSLVYTDRDALRQNVGRSD